MSSPVFNLSDAKGFTVGHGARFEGTHAQIGPLIGAKQIGCTLSVVEPGKRAFPFHNHHGNEEMFVILEGSGTYRHGDAEYPIEGGCVCAAPAGGPETAHQIINTGSETLKYLALSTMQDPEVVEYPDSGKLAAIAIGPGNTFMNANLRHVARPDQTLDYWDGEE
jgi:uncharacterized cupin superfamily protein